MKDNFSLQNSAKKILKSVIAFSLSLFLPLFLSYIIFPPEEEILFAERSLAIIFAGFIFGLILKVNYTKMIFLIDLILAVFIASYYSFTIGFITLTAALIIQKLLKLL